MTKNPTIETEFIGQNMKKKSDMMRSVFLTLFK